MCEEAEDEVAHVGFVRHTVGAPGLAPGHLAPECLEEHPVGQAEPAGELPAAQQLLGVPGVIGSVEQERILVEAEDVGLALLDVEIVVDLGDGQIRERGQFGVRLVNPVRDGSNVV